ncbi:MAG: formate dehydrogenase subunit alpha, partial [Gemmatimonadetes bacterium]|nr:formate dehydrogenase subunit alpha [Gemmatimonadota bacterium]
KTEWKGAAEVMDEIARVTPTYRGISFDRLEELGSLQYPVPTKDHPGTSFLFSEKFPTPDGKALLVPVEYLPPDELPDAEYPFVLNTGRQMYHWHTGTMTRRSTGLDAREPTPVVDMHAADALALGVGEGDTVRVTSRRGSMLIGVRVSDRQAKGQIFIPMHFREAAANLLTNPKLDPYAKQASFKISAVKIEAVAAERSGGLAVR